LILIDKHRWRFEFWFSIFAIFAVHRFCGLRMMWGYLVGAPLLAQPKPVETQSGSYNRGRHPLSIFERVEGDPPPDSSQPVIKTPQGVGVEEVISTVFSSPHPRFLRSVFIALCTAGRKGKSASKVDDISASSGPVDVVSRFRDPGVDIPTDVNGVHRPFLKKITTVPSFLSQQMFQCFLSVVFFGSFLQ